MKKKVINKCIEMVKKSNKYSDTKLEEIEYGLTSIYLLITKIIFISLIALILGIFKEMIVLMIIYNIIRMPSFGLHATKSYICLIVSTLIFIGVPLICINFNFSIYIKSIIGILGIILMYKYSPADTEKRPIVNIKRRCVYKMLSIIITFIYVLIALLYNNYITEYMIFSIIIQCVIIHPMTYKIFNMPYDNYKLFSIRV